MTRFEAAFQDSPLRPTSKTQARVEQKEAADKYTSPQSISQLQGEIAQGLEQVRRCIEDIHVLQHHSDIEIEKSLASMQRKYSSALSLGLVLEVL